MKGAIFYIIPKNPHHHAPAMGLTPGIDDDETNFP
jgi:hypothetical protein